MPELRERGEGGTRGPEEKSVAPKPQVKRFVRQQVHI